MLLQHQFIRFLLTGGFAAGVNIVSRYLFPNPVPWTDEVALIAFLWLIFWVGGLLLGESEHVRFNVLMDMLPDTGRRALAGLGVVIVAGLFGAALPTILDYIAFLWREKTSVLQIRLDWVFACFGLALIAIVLRALRRLAGLLGPRWRDHL